jgi:hypothetical protein
VDDASGLEATVYDLLADPDTLIHDALVDVGEEAPASPRITDPHQIAPKDGICGR